MFAFPLICQPGPKPQADAQIAEAALPDSPEPQTPASSPVPKSNPCPPAAPNPGPNTAAAADHPGALSLNSRPGNPEPGNSGPGNSASGNPAPSPNSVSQGSVPCRNPIHNWYGRFVDGPHDKPLTPRDKAWLAARNLIDPFNLITIGGDAAISVGINSHSDYGPGMRGFARYVGVSFTEDMTGEFFGTFLIPSVAHQDPHYYRMQHARFSHRIGHALLQVLWTQGDNGRGMLNYANLVGFACDDEVANLYVPGRETTVPASFRRYATALGTAPIGNFVNEFLPDVARHIHVQIVVIQRIINQVADKETMNASNSP